MKENLLKKKDRKWTKNNEEKKTKNLFKKHQCENEQEMTEK